MTMNAMQNLCINECTNTNTHTHNTLMSLRDQDITDPSLDQRTHFELTAVRRRLAEEQRKDPKLKPIIDGLQLKPIVEGLLSESKDQPDPPLNTRPLDQPVDQPNQPMDLDPSGSDTEPDAPADPKSTPTIRKPVFRLSGEDHVLVKAVHFNTARSSTSTTYWPLWFPKHSYILFSACFMETLLSSNT